MTLASPMVEPTAHGAPPRCARRAREDDRQQVAALVHLEAFAHQHPGWFAPLDRLGDEGFVVCQRRGHRRLEAALAVLKETDATAWVRLFACGATVEPAQAWEWLWPEAVRVWQAQGVRWVAAMPFADWFRTLLLSHGFEFLEDVQVLVWQRGRSVSPQVRPVDGVRLRPMVPADLEAVAAIDAAAFGDFWRMPLTAFRLALGRSVWATVAENAAGELLGFQMSTPSPLGGHLARLAVHPLAQHRGIGRWLVSDTLAFFARNHAEKVTLNTQGNNARAIALYRSLGFDETNEVYPVYRYALKGS